MESLDLSRNAFNNSIFPFINAATSLRTLLLPSNNMDGLFPAKGMFLFHLYISSTVYFLMMYFLLLKISVLIFSVPLKLSLYHSSIW